MKRIRLSIVLSLGLILTACLLAAAAAGVHPEKKCYNSSGDEIPCNSNYYETQFAARATAREAGPTAPAVAAASATASPTVTPTSTATPTESPAPTLTQAQEASPPASASQAAPSQASNPQPGTTKPSALMVLIPVLMLGGAGLLFVILLYLLFRWLTGRRNAPPGPPS